MTTNEVRKGDFVFRDTLFADSGADKLHPRASVAELKDLLLPKKGHVALKDQTAHWYSAQLLHYGLPRTKDKNTAKVRLTSAINAGSLLVPPHLIQLEADMRKEFASAQRKVKASLKKAAAVLTPEEPNLKGKKRKADCIENSPAVVSTKVAVRVGNVSINIDQHENAISTTNKRKAASRIVKPEPVRSKSDPTKGKKGPNQTKAPRQPKQTTTTSPVTDPGTTKAIPRVKQTARKSNSTAVPASHRPSGQVESRDRNRKAAPNPPSPVHTFDGSHARQRYSDDDSMGDAPPPYDSLGFSDDYSAGDERAFENHIQISGSYAVSALSDNIRCELDIVKDTQNNEFWARFVVGGQEGVLRFSNTVDLATQRRAEFIWRAQDLNSGQLRFKRGQNGWMQFDGQGSVRGCWNELLHNQDIHFEGMLDGQTDMEVEEVIDQWEWFVKSAYRR